MADVQIAIIDQQNTQIALAAPPETQVTAAVPGVQGPKGEGVPLGGTANQVLFKQSSTNYDTAWGAITSAMIGDLQIVDGDVSTTAAIAGTKISPNFGSQNVVTTGTNTAASFIPTSSSVPTNGVYLPAANTVAVATNGTPRVTVDSSGLVNIGDSGQLVIGKGEAAIPTNSVKAHIFWGIDSIYSGTSGDLIMMPRSSAAANFRVYTGSTTPSERFRITGTGQLSFIGAGSAASPAVGFNGSAPSNSLVITSAGLVGVGTSAPNAILSIKPSASSTTGATTFTGDGLYIDCANTTDGNGNYGGAISWSRSGSSTTRTAAITNVQTATDSDVQGLAFLTHSSTTSTNPLIEAMRITGAGLVGIGTSSPVDKLHVDGRIAVTTDSSTPTTGEAFFYKSSTGAVMSGFGATIETGGAGSRQARVSVDSSGRVGIGTTSPTSTNGGIDIASGGLGLVIGADGSLSSRTNATNKQARIAAYHYTNAEEPIGALTVFSTSTQNGVYIGGGTSSVNAATSIEFYTAADTTTTTGSERARIDSSGRLLVGTSTARAAAGITSAFQVEGSGNYNNYCVNLIANTTVDAAASPALIFGRSRGTTNGSFTTVTNGDRLGSIAWTGANGANLSNVSALIECYVDGTVSGGGANDMPGRLVFSTTADGASSPTERMRITNAGVILVGTTTTPTGASSGSVVAQDRLVLSAEGAGRTQIRAGDIGTVTATTGTAVFRFKFNTASINLAAFVKISVSQRANSATASNSPQAEYMFQLHQNSSDVITLNGATSAFEYTYVRATHFAFADAGSNECTVTLTNPTGSSLAGCYKVQIMSHAGLCVLQSVTTT